MLKSFKLSTAVILLFAQSAFAGVTFERIKEEMWFKGEEAVKSVAKYETLGESAQIEDLQAAWESWQGTQVMPEELETGLALWISKK